MVRRVRNVVVIFGLAGAILAGPTLAKEPKIEDLLSQMLSGKPMLNKRELENRIAKAQAFPLGSKENPVRATMPAGQRAYLSRLRCSDGKAPSFERAGNVGPGIYESIVDLYVVSCGKAAPGEVQVQIDMYHGGYVEDKPVPGFTITPR